jgi:cytochrome c-type biogenesis protein
VPFLLAALATDRFLAASRRMRRAIPVLEKVSGGLLVVVGILLLTGSFTMLSSYFIRFTPDWVLRRI